MRDAVYARRYALHSFPPRRVALLCISYSRVLTINQCKNIVGLHYLIKIEVKVHANLKKS